MALGATGFLEQEAYLSSKMLVGAHKGFNELSRVAIICTVWHRWPAGARFEFNLYKHFSHLLIRHPGDTPVMLLSQEAVTHGYPSW